MQLAKYGYQGVKIGHVVRDEVQDFVQGELLLDVLVLGPQHAANVMYCGDTAQTITRGVGFRWVEVSRQGVACTSLSSRTVKAQKQAPGQRAACVSACPHELL
jgi:hypothetical protein